MSWSLLGTVGLILLVGFLLGVIAGISISEHEHARDRQLWKAELARVIKQLSQRV